MNELDVIIEKHTKALTRTYDPDGTDVVSFDTRVVDTHEMAQDILDWHRKALISELEGLRVDTKTIRTIGYIPRAEYEERDIRQGFNDAVNELNNKIDARIKELGL